MPGISQECESGNHQACMIGLDCRCAHHLHTQQLLQKAAPKNGHKRSRVKEITEPEIACPKCGTKAKSSDNFCRKDGARIMAGKPCARCSEVGESDDVFCFACGWKHGEPIPVEAPAPVLTRQEQIDKLKKLAEARGIDPSRVDMLLKETVVE